MSVQDFEVRLRLCFTTAGLCFTIVGLYFTIYGSIRRYERNGQGINKCMKDGKKAVQIRQIYKKGLYITFIKFFFMTHIIL